MEESLDNSKRNIKVPILWLGSRAHSNPFLWSHEYPKFKDYAPSDVAFGKCNFGCLVCVSGKFINKNTPYLPFYKMVSLDYILRYVSKEAKRGHIIRLYGGEPLCFPEISFEILKRVKENGGRTEIHTNASKPSVVKKLFKFCDLLDIDIKGPPRYVEKMTRSPKSLSWDAPVESLKIASKNKKRGQFLEVFTLVYNFTEFADLATIAKVIPDNVYWNLKGVHTTVRKPISLYEAKEEVKKEISGIKPTKKEHLIDLGRKIVKKYPRFHGRLLALTRFGEKQDKRIYMYF